MSPEIRRIGQLFRLGSANLLWLVYTVAVASWVHRIAGPVHELCRRYVRRRRNKDADRRVAALRRRLSQGACTSAQNGPRVALATLSPELEEICRPLRSSQQEITLADIDQDGSLAPRYSSLWSGAVTAAQPFLQRRRFAITVVDWNGWVGVRKDFRGDTAAFANELEAVLDLRARGCAVPEVFAVDFDPPSITFSYIAGTVVREALAQAGAPLRDRDLRTLRNAALHRIRQHWLDRTRTASGRRLIGRVLDKDSISRIEAGLLAIHRSGYCLGDIKYGNVIIQTDTGIPYFIDFEYALPLDRFNRAAATYLRDCDSDKLNALFGTNLPTAKGLRRLLSKTNGEVYSPFYVGSGVHWGAFWNPDLGIQRWRHILAEHVPVPRGGRVLDLGANNGFNAIQMLRAGASEVVAVEINPAAIEQGQLVKRIFEWADNTEYRLHFICGSHGDIASMDLGRFDLVTAFCTLYYLSQATMAKTVAQMASLTDTLVLQCNDERWIDRQDAATFEKASLQFNTALVRSNGFPHVSIVETSGSQRPLVIGRTHAESCADPGKHDEFTSANMRAAGFDRSFRSERGAREPAAVRGRVSVIIPAYNAAATVERTLYSVINQTYPDLEILVVDDGSTDETAVLAQQIAMSDKRIRLLNKVNGGLVSARNHGIARATGEFIAQIDADDIWHPSKIEKQVALMRRSSDTVGVVYTWARGIDERDRILFDITPACYRGDVYAALVLKCFINSGAPMFRRVFVDEVGGYDPTLSQRGAVCCEDVKFYLDLAERCHFDLVPEFLLGYRFRPGSMSTDFDAMLRSYELLLDEAGMRHRQLPSRILRWARAHQHLEIGLACLGDRRFSRAWSLLSRALWEDPIGSSQRLMRRVAARVERRRGHVGIRRLSFFDADPTVFCDHPRPQVGKRRFSYIMGIRMRSLMEPGRLQGT